MKIESTNGVQFITTDIVDFNDEVGREITIYERDINTGDPTLYLAKKYVQAISAVRNQKEVTFGSYENFVKHENKTVDQNLKKVIS